MSLRNANCRLSVELVPRDVEVLKDEIKRVHQHFPQITTINIPDLVRYPIRSWDGCVLAKDHFSSAIPHLRAMDMPEQPILPMLDVLDANGITEVLVISGDEPVAGEVHRGPDSLEIIQRFKTLAPHIKVYAALDPYRTNIQHELAYAQQKLEAGAAGLFTQPFFDHRLMQIYADQLQGCAVWWGLSPVVTEASKNYWSRVNRVVFPASFQADLAWNQAFARDVLDMIHEMGHHIYFMPIRVPVEDYLAGVLAE
ncbi:5,10-methylenetetrahydrofolate reductase-related protein [Magnetococcus marinus MC-1]|uniref:Methylenetetrahydrofolate reductase n=1 Tax=Magnetococcus marinus (strain ATCC BAA-1437 / JCM 17883 / MC-1) TaxID=156889 RepID=A0L7S2_MAGMM|nr:methylenetetrahydrofolate reductase [Magnetococcus marinus]ABK44015.1 5,10-methylenetetrahydrofolate reductase-related protein [Magnetococcus marinus MC-1]